MSLKSLIGKFSLTLYKLWEPLIIKMYCLRRALPLSLSLSLSQTNKQTARQTTLLQLSDVDDAERERDARSSESWDVSLWFQSHVAGRRTLVPDEAEGRRAGPFKPIP